VNRVLLLLAALLLGSRLAVAQVIERQFQKPPEPRAVPGGAQIPEAVQQAPANAEAIRFTLNRVVVEGATVYPAEDLQKAYEAFLGKEISLGDIYRIAETLTARYRNDGYILSQVIVPAQAIEAGTVRLQAIEGHVSEVRLEGGTDQSRANAQDYVDKIKAARPLKAEALERYLLLMNDVPGAAARAVLAPSKTEPAASDLVIQLSQRQFSGGLSVDNRGGRALGPTRITGNADAYLALGRGARTGLMFATSGNDKLNYLSLQYDQLVGSEGGKIALAANISRSDPGTFAIIPLNLATNAETYTASYIHPAIRSRSQNLYFRGTFSAYNGKTDLFGVPDTEDHLRVLRAGVTYDFADSLAATNIIDAELSHGLRGLGASSNGDPMLSRPNGLHEDHCVCRQGPAHRRELVGIRRVHRPVRVQQRALARTLQLRRRPVRPRARPIRAGRGPRRGNQARIALLRRVAARFGRKLHGLRLLRSWAGSSAGRRRIEGRRIGRVVRVRRALRDWPARLGLDRGRETRDPRGRSRRKPGHTFLRKHRRTFLKLGESWIAQALQAVRHAFP
jgi:hypothetical protein